MATGSNIFMLTDFFCMPNIDQVKSACHLHKLLLSTMCIYFIFDIQYEKEENKKEMYRLGSC